MRWNGISASLTMTLLCPVMLAANGCQTTTVGGVCGPGFPPNTADYQYFPAEPEFKLSNQVQALEEYKLEREKLRAGVDDEAGQ
jgi:hypothetical protein